MNFFFGFSRYHEAIPGRSKAFVIALTNLFLIRLLSIITPHAPPDRSLQVSGQFFVRELADPRSHLQRHSSVDRNTLFALKGTLIVLTLALTATMVDWSN
jgi:hypothetical protein